VNKDKTRCRGFVLVEVLLLLLAAELLLSFAGAFCPVLRQRMETLRREFACQCVSGAVLSAQACSLAGNADACTVYFRGDSLCVLEGSRPVLEVSLAGLGLGDYRVGGGPIQFTGRGNVKKGSRFYVFPPAGLLPDRTYWLEPVRGRLNYEDGK